ncbi:MAG: hypothetical protein H6707_06150 [Deltaproteobacteria bacterium]|nr:hypothetical protein [Deltaproteobacteria bacterium]
MVRALSLLISLTFAGSAWGAGFADLVLSDLNVKSISGLDVTFEVKICNRGDNDSKVPTATPIKVGVYEAAIDSPSTLCPLPNGAKSPDIFSGIVTKFGGLSYNECMTTDFKVTYSKQASFFSRVWINTDCFGGVSERTADRTLFSNSRATSVDLAPAPQPQGKPDLEAKAFVPTQVLTR